MAGTETPGAGTRPLFAYLLLAFALLWGWQYSQEHAQIDFHAQAAVASIADRPEVHNIYDPDALPHLREILYTRDLQEGADELELSLDLHMPGVVASPFCFAVFRTLHSDDYYRAWRRFRMLILLGLAIGIYLPSRHLGLAPSESALAAALFCNPVFEPTRSLLRAGNVASLQLASAALLLWVASRPASRPRDLVFGTLAALLVLFKPNLLPLLPLVAVLRLSRRETTRLRDESLGVAAGTVLAILLANLSLGGAHHWTHWAEYLPEFLAAPPPLSRGNFALSQLLPGKLSPLLAWSGLCLASWSIFVAARDDAGASPQRQLANTMSLALGLSVLAGQLVWLHYQLLLAPLIVVALVPATPPSPQWAPHRRVFALTAFACVALQPVRELLGLRGDVEQAWVVNLGLVTLLGLVILDPFMARRSRATSTASPTNTANRAKDG